MNKIHVILLAAGLSSRMGQVKPLLPWRGKTLLENACRAYGHVTGRKLVVLNKAVEAAADVVSPYGFQSVINEYPERGQSESLRLGLAELDRLGASGAVLCAVVDQPLINDEIVRTICDAYEAKSAQSDCASKLILCPRYGHSKERGNPVVFGPYWRPLLAELTGDTGGRQILKGPGAPHVAYIDFEMNAGTDVDTPDEYKELYNTWGYE